MKKIILTALAAVAYCTASAQFNLQLHYDLGSSLYDIESGRQKATITAEYFRADRLGSTYLFIDLDQNGKGMGGNIGAYAEIGRDFTFANIKNSNSSLTAHIEYDGGLSASGGVFQPAALLGPTYQWHSNDFSKTFTLQLLYKQFFKHGSCNAVSGFQVTPVWGITFADGLCTFCGFADLWYGYIPQFGSDGQKKGLVFLSEPQFWVNVLGKDRQNDKFSIGTEIEVSNNFIWSDNLDKHFFINPTLAVKYTF